MDILKKNKKRWKLALALLGIIIFLMWPKATSFTKKSIRAGISPTEEITLNNLKERIHKVEHQIYPENLLRLEMQSGE